MTRWGTTVETNMDKVPRYGKIDRLSIITNLVKSCTNIVVGGKPKLVSLRQNLKKLIAGTGNAHSDLRGQTKQARIADLVFLNTVQGAHDWELAVPETQPTSKGNWNSFDWDPQSCLQA